MPLHKLSQKSFVNGQYDRTAQNQESVSGGGIVASGLSYAKNVLSSDKGELRKRLGTKFLKQLDGATVLIPFRMNDENDVVLTVDTTSVKGLKYIDNGVEPLLSVRPDADISFPAGNTWSDGTVSTGTVSNGNWTLSFTFYKVSSGSTLGSLGAQYPGYLINGHHTTSTWEGYQISTNKTTAPQSITISNSSTACCMRSIKLWFWTATSVGYQYKYWENPVIQYSDDGNTWTGVQTDYKAGEYTPISYTPPQEISGHGTIPARYLSKNSLIITQTNYSENHKYWRVYFQTGTASSGIFIDNVSFVDAGDTHLFEETVSFTEEQLKNIKYSQDKNIMFIACEGVIPYRLLNNTGELTWGSFIPENTPTLWEIIGGYPAAVSLFQNRLWFGGFQNNPTTVIASKFDDYETFNSSSPVQKDDYLNLRCNQLKTKIRNLVGGQNVMCCFSEDGISYIDGGSTGLLATNENIEFKLKNRMPAGSSTPGFKDDVMLYSSSDGTKLYGVDYDLLVSRFQVNDLAIYAKDVTQDKITELHYVNNESKLVYGLTEAGKMFALLYEKGAYQGFFPLDFNGVIYDICPVKVGRDYKLLMVVFRDGNWYLEEKLDCGHYIDTSTPRLTSEEKKWATYDNLENNVALDCYQAYDESFAGEVYVGDTTHIISSVDLSSYVGKTVMLSNENDKDFVVCRVNSVALRAAWGSETDGSNPICCTVTENPDAGEPVYNLHELTSYQTISDIPFVVRSVEEVGGILQIYMVGTEEDPVSGVIPTRTYYRSSIGDEYLVDVTVEAIRGNSTAFTKIYPEFTEFTPNLPQVADVAVISEGRYFNATKPDENAKIYLPAPCHKVIYGVPYESVAILKIQAPYESLKQVAQVDVSVIDTTHLELGTDFSDTQNIEKIDDSSYYDLTRITMNDTYRLVLSDTPETVKNLILRSNKGVPFTVIAIDMYINYSNLGGD
jgi:hypothetical protein